MKARVVPNSDDIPRGIAQLRASVELAKSETVERGTTMRTRSLTNMFVATSVLLFVGQGILIAQSPPRRLSAEFQNNSSTGGSGEKTTNAAAQPAGAGGTVVWSKTVTVTPNFKVLYVTFSAQGDSHNGSALLMNATVNGTLIQPLAGQTAAGGGGPHEQTGWYTLNHLPEATLGGVTNCNDGGGGPADCHDNAISFSGCVRLDLNAPTPLTVNIKMADLPGGDANFAFYQRSTIYIDAQEDPDGSLCKGAS